MLHQKKKIRLYLLCLLCTLLCACSLEHSSKKADNKQNNILNYQNEYSLTKVRMTGGGDNSNDYKIGFKPSEKSDGITAYLVGYSCKEINEVRDYLMTLSQSEIYALDKPVNRAYLITDLSYADGVGNTLNTDQKDIITGGDITEPGTYTFYACTIGEKGLLGIEQANQTVVKEPYAGNLSVKVDANVDEVSGSFKSYESDAILKNIVFYSRNGYAAVKQAISKYSVKQLNALIQDNCALSFKNAVNTTFTLSLNQLMEVDGNTYNQEGLYYLYVASIGENGIVGLSYCDNTFLTPKTLPKPLETIGNGTGHGFVFPNGGAATIGRSRASIISKSQSMFRTIAGTPRIAVLGASSGTEKDIYSYFYIDDASADSYLQRFQDAGFEAVYIPLTAGNYETVGENEYFASLIESCHGVYLTGGDQSKAARALYQEDGSLNMIGEAIMNVYNRGGIIMGTSAGAHIVSNPCFQDGTSYSALYYNGAEAFDISKLLGDKEVSANQTGKAIYYSGLDLAKSAAKESLIFDSHFNARGRFGRLALICRDTGMRYGAGLDEATGLAVSDGIGTVFGAGGVTIIDTKNAVFGHDKSFEVKGLEVYYLSAGDRFDFRTCMITPTRDKKKLTGFGQPEEIKDIFAPNYAVTRAFLSFLQSKECSKSYQALSDMGDDTLPPINVTLTRSEQTAIYQSETMKYDSINALAEYKKTAYEKLLVDITGF